MKKYCKTPVMIALAGVTVVTVILFRVLGSGHQIAPELSNSSIETSSNLNSLNEKRAIEPVRPKQQFKKGLAVGENSTEDSPHDNAQLDKIKALAREASTNSPFKAIDYLKEALSLKTNDIDSIAMLGQINLGLSNFDEARYWAFECLEQDPTNVSCSVTLISAFEAEGDTQNSMGYLRDCLKQKSDNLYCLSTLAYHEIKEENLNSAEQLINEMKQSYPKSGWTQLILAQYYEKVGKMKLSKSHFDRACTTAKYFCKFSW